MRRITRVPDHEAPGVGTQRRMPLPDEQPIQSAPLFPMRTTAECYDAFPTQIKSSCPAQVTGPQTPAGPDLAKVANAGPDSGHRHRPAPEAERPVEVPATVESDVLERNRRLLQGRLGEQ